MKSSLYQAFRRKLSPELWRTGLSLYHAGNITAVEIYGGLVQAKVKGFSNNLAQARLKLQPGSSPLVWTECSCLLSRRKAEPCEHVAALCVYLSYQDGFYEEQHEPFPDSTNPKTSKTEPNIPALDHDVKPMTQFSHNLRARRVFYADSNEDARLKVSKVIEVFDLEHPTSPELYFLDGRHDIWLRHDGIVKEPEGFISFYDFLDENQETFWIENPSTFEATDDVIPLCLEGSNSSFFRGISVIKSESLSKISIIKKIGSITYKDVEDKNSYQESKKRQAWVHFSAEDPDSSGDNIIILPLVALLETRRQGREYLKTKKGLVYIGNQFDWLLKKQEKVPTTLNTQDIIRLEAEIQKNSNTIRHQSQDAWIDRLKDGLFSSFEDFAMPPYTLKKMSLRQYQTDGLKWLWWLYEYGLGGILADEMGLGKTHQALALFETILQNRKSASGLFLVVCPNTVMEHWLDKVEQYTSRLLAIRYHGTERHTQWALIKKHAQKKTNQACVLVTSYGLLLKDYRFFSTLRWDVVVLDEAHLIKNRKTQTYQAALRIQSDLRLCLTGTPIENDLSELKTIFDYILPNYLSGIKDLRKMIHLVQPFKLRRKKADVLKDLPDKTEDIRHCIMTLNQRELYTKTLKLQRESVVETLSNEQNPIPYIHIFSLITLLKQICDDPGLIDPQYDGIESGKLQLFDTLLAEALAENKKIVVFSQYAKMVLRLSEHLQKKNIGHAVLTGQTRNRGEVIRSFQEDESKKVFLGSLLAGGMGIDLTSASIVIHFDRWWNAAKENQGTDRVHRIGQTQRVQVYKLVTKNSIEEKIDALILRKKQLLDDYLDSEENFLRKFSREEFLSLLT